MTDEPSSRSVRDVARSEDPAALLAPVRRLASRKWAPVIVFHLLDDGPMGFGELRRSVEGISSKMLSESLDELEDADIVDRTVLDTKPIRVEYGLTARGDALEPVLVSMMRWGRDAIERPCSGRGAEARPPRTASARTDGGRDPQGG